MRGCILKRGKSFAVVVYLGRGEVRGRDGQTRIGERQKWYSHRRKDAEKHLTQLLTQLDSGGMIVVTKKSVGDYLDEWLRGHKPNLAPTTYVSYSDTIRNHLAPKLGHVPLARLSPQAIRDYIAGKLAGGLSDTSVRYHVTLLHTALGQAVRDGLLMRNACDAVKAPRRRRLEMRVLDEELVRLFLAEAKRSSPYYRLYLAAITTGMREGELLGLRWRDVDIAMGTVAIQQTFYRLGENKKEQRATQLLFKAPKTPKARRTVNLPEILVEELRRLREEQTERRRMLGERYGGPRSRLLRAQR